MGTAHAQDILDMKNKLIQSSLELAAVQSWADISMHDIAAHAGVDIENAMALCPDKDSVFMAYCRQVDWQIEENLNGAFADGDTQRDKLFDIMMERFDILNENRAGVISIVNAVTMNPIHGLNSLPNLCQSATFMAGFSDMDINGWRGALTVAGLCGVYLNALRAWVSDDTPDMATTMASVDKGLGYLDRVEKKITTEENRVKQRKNKKPLCSSV